MFESAPPDLDTQQSSIPLIPHCREAEEAVCGAILINPEMYYEAAEVLTAGDFYIHRLRWLFEAFTALHERKTPIDMLTVADELEAQGKLAEFGGPSQLTALVNQVPTSLNAVSYARIVKGHAGRRKMIRAAGEIAKLAYDTSREAATAFSEAEREWQGVRREADTGGRLLGMRDLLDNAYDRLEAISKLGRPPGISSNLLDLDRILHGFKKGRYYLVAARPGEGKTALLLTLAKNFMKRENKSVLYVSIEMQENMDENDALSGGELSERLLGMEAHIDTMAISDGRLTEEEYPLFVHAIDTMQSWRFTVDDDPNVTPDMIMARALKVRGDIGLDVILVDYIQIQETPVGMKFGTRAEQVAYLSKRLKKIAKELNVVMIVAAQVNRAYLARGDKHLNLGDLKESGSLEQDAHVVIFIQPTDQDTLKDVEVAKHRGGPVGSCKLFYKASETEFCNSALRDDNTHYWWQNGNGNGKNGKNGKNHG